jgi:putative pyruvate formate lyase activating enzyme
MKRESRRQFVKSCLYAAAGLWALGTGLLSSLLAGCRRTARTAPPLPVEPGAGAESAAAPTARIAPDFEPAYLRLHRTGELRDRGQELWDIMTSCRLCPRQCGFNRHDVEGFCQASSQLEIAGHSPHFGEERPLVGQGGSGTIFFTNCSLRCVFCINWEISQEGKGYPRSVEDLADMMLDLQRRGCHNINLVTPTHYSAHILLAVDRAAARGLRLPLVYNTCGWERLDILRKLDGVVDIYLPDFKYADGAMAAKYSSDADAYPDITKAALLEMQRQVGVAKPAPDGLVYRGLMVRHLVMPNRIGGTKAVVEWIAENLPKDTYLNIMSQYTPMYKAFQFPEISRRITSEEYAEALRWAKEAGLTAVLAQA